MLRNIEKEFIFVKGVITSLWIHIWQRNYQEYVLGISLTQKFGIKEFVRNTYLGPFIKRFLLKEDIGGFKSTCSHFRLNISVYLYLHLLASDESF